MAAGLAVGNGAHQMLVVPAATIGEEPPAELPRLTAPIAGHADDVELVEGGPQRLIEGLIPEPNIVVAEDDGAGWVGLGQGLVVNRPKGPLIGKRHLHLITAVGRQGQAAAQQGVAVKGVSVEPGG